MYGRKGWQWSYGIEYYEHLFAASFKALQLRLRKIHDWEYAQRSKRETQSNREEIPTCNQYGQSESARVVLICMDSFSGKDEDYANELRMFIA
jgi:hypothetical protein